MVWDLNCKLRRKELSDTQKQIDTDTEEDCLKVPDKVQNKALAKLGVKKKEYDLAKIEVMMILSTPESKQRRKDMTDIVKKKQKTILDTELTKENFNDVHKLDTTDEEEELYSNEKNKQMYCTPELISELKEHPVYKDMKKDKVIDLRRQVRKKTPASYLDSLTKPKLSFDMGKRLEALEKRMQAMEEANKLAAELNRRKFEAVGLAMVNMQTNLESGVVVNVTNQEKLEFLMSLGVDPRKIALYNVKLENPSFTYKQLADVTHVSRRTAAYWLAEIEKVVGSKFTKT
jgi:hypothetical protein